MLMVLSKTFVALCSLNDAKGGTPCALFCWFEGGPPCVAFMMYRAVRPAHCFAGWRADCPA